MLKSRTILTIVLGLLTVAGAAEASGLHSAGDTSNIARKNARAGRAVRSPASVGDRRSPVSRLVSVGGAPVAVRVLGTDAAGTPPARFIA